MTPATECLDLFDHPTAVAIIGMAGRFPGARSLDAFRRNLENGVESIVAFTGQELARAGVDRTLLADPHYVKVAPLLEDADQFDAAFFDYSPREALIMDPQQRLFLECAWEALEDAGHAGDAAGTNTGVFSGGGGVMSTYLLSDVHFNPQLTGPTASLQHVGNDKDYLSSRVSYKLDLRGPSFAVQTACSTSLVAIHLACQSLLHGECDMALAGGTTVRVPQRAGYLYREGNVFSRDGHCRAFDADATGTVFGSAIGVVVLKRLKDAVRDGDPIRAVIRGTAINNDGSENKNSYWAPHADGQAAAMRRALAVARVDPATIGYVEAHGTATKRGDPTEVRALVQAFSPDAHDARSHEGHDERSHEGHEEHEGIRHEGHEEHEEHDEHDERDEHDEHEGTGVGAATPRCAIGSVKSNIGHTESAAGVVGLIKAVLSLEHQVLYPTLHYRRPNPEIDFGDRFYVNAALAPWPEAPHPRRAGVNSLGVGGTNAFVIVEEAPPIRAVPRLVDRSCHVLALSAKSPAALEALVDRYRTHLQSHPDEFADVCYTAGAGRARFSHRLAFAAASADEAIARLADAADPAVRRGEVAHGSRPRIAFLFTGQGSQYVQMAGELYRTQPAFRETFDRCADALASWLDRPLRDVVFRAGDAPSSIDQTAYTQPALFAIEYALAALWRSWGVEPTVVLGHSVGELAAACVAGVMSLDDGLRLIAARGRLMQALPPGGGMAALRCDVARADAAIAPYRETISIAALNGPAEVVISGRVEDLDVIVAGLEREGIRATRLKVSHAFHSPLMQPMLAEFERVARSIHYAPPAIPLVSNLTGALATADIATPEYWVRHVMAPVRCADGLLAAQTFGADVLLEVGPAPILLGMARQSLPQTPRALLPTLRPGVSDWRQIADSVAALFALGAPVDWAAFDRAYSRRRVHLPTYPFQRKRFWVDAAPHGTVPAAGGRPALLGARLRLPGSSEVRFETQWGPHAPPYLDDHRIFDTVVVPGASHVAATLAVLQATGRQDGCVLEDVVFPQALTLAAEGVRTAQIVLKHDGNGDGAFEVTSLREGADETEAASWVVHATGTVSRPGVAPEAARVDPQAWLARCPRSITGAEFYDAFWDAGYHLRGAFRWIANVHAGDGEVVCEMAWPDLPDDPGLYPLYPSLIDACFQSVFGDKGRDLLQADAVYVPFSLRRVAFHGSPRPGARLWCHVALPDLDGPRRPSVDADITLCDDSGQVVASIDGCQLREVRRSALVHEPATDLRESLYTVEWQALPRVTAPGRPAVGEAGLWLVFGESTSGVGDDLIERLRARGARCIRVDAGEAFSQTAPGRYTANPSSPEHVRRLLVETTADAANQCRGIVHLWSLDEEEPSTSNSTASTLHLVQALAQTELKTAPRLWLVTRGAQPVQPSPAPLAVQQAPLWGLGRIVALEHPELACVRVDLDPADEAGDGRLLLEDLWAPDQQDQFAYRRGVRYVPRLVRWPLQAAAAQGIPASGPVQVRLSAYGQFDHLGLQPLTRRAPGPGEVEVEVRATGLNFRDVLNALGLLQTHYARHLGVSSAAEMTFGFECAGTIAAVGDGVTGLRAGDAVIVAATHDALASFVTVRQEFVVRKPAAVSFEDAATLPLAFLTASYGLHHLATLQPGDRVLVHAAAGGVGLACVRWAQHVGAEVFATASPGKWPFLRALGVHHVMSSRTLDFADTIRDLTGGEGVDVVVNTLSGEFVDRSFAVLKPGGRFVELGKRDVWSADQARERRPDVAYFPFDLVDVSRRDPATIAAMLRDMLARIDAGALGPLPRTTFPVARVAEAFRYMAEARHTGKIVITMPPLTAEATKDTKATTASYLITGGLGALGLETAGALVAQGARHLVLTGRRRPSAEAQAAIARLEESGARVQVVEADIADAAQVARLLATVRETMPPLRGVVHAAGVLDDGVLLQQTGDRFRTVMAPKVEGTWHLHAQTRDLPLDFFVCFSSVASLVGNAGQGNYAAANAFMDALMHERRARGLAGLSLNWGPWGDVGMAAEGGGQRERRLAAQGFRTIAPAEGVQTFVRLLQADAAQVGVMPVSWPEFLQANAAGLPFFERVAAPKPKVPAARQSDIRRQLEEAADPKTLLVQHVRAVVGKVLGIADPSEIDTRARLFDLGLESLMAVELRGRFEESLGCPLRPTLLFDYPTVESLAEHLAAKVADRKAPAAAEPAQAIVPAGPVTTQPAVSAAFEDIQDLGEDDVAEQLARELGLPGSAQPS